MPKADPLLTTGETVSEEVIGGSKPPDTIPDNTVPHAYGCLDSRCVPTCPHFDWSLVSESQLESMVSEAHQVGSWALQYLLEPDREGEDLISKGIRLFGGGKD